VPWLASSEFPLALKRRGRSCSAQISLSLALAYESFLAKLGSFVLAFVAMEGLTTHANVLIEVLHHNFLSPARKHSSKAFLAV